MYPYFQILKTFGHKWVLQRLIYELKIRSGSLQRKTPVQAWESVSAPEITGKFFAERVDSKVTSPCEIAIPEGQFKLFSYYLTDMGFPPDWFENPFSRNEIDKEFLPSVHWTGISDFEYGDIKCIWELSRFGWVYPLIDLYSKTGKERYIRTFWVLVEDWAEKNPPNRGVHWKCGQEIAVRLLALTSAYFAFAGAAETSRSRERLLRKILFASARRIEANIHYALRQENNHGVSEATGLYTAGLLFGETRWTEKGAKFLESQAFRLIYQDGSFSQHSTNYHRVMLQNFLWAIALGRVNGLEFSSGLLDSVRSAGRWLRCLMDEKTGRVPNLGANDGALVLPVGSDDYLDYRPTIQAVGAVVDGEAWLSEGTWDELAAFLGARVKDRKPGADINPAGNHYFSNGGYAVLRNEKRLLLLRCPEKCEHRPSQCDILHMDLWVNGINILRDGGSYSYNCEQPWQDYFKSVNSHNTIAFDEHDQMPQLSRFLYGRWPRLSVRYDFAGKQPFIEAMFTDWKGCRHQRRVDSDDALIRVTDEIAFFKEKAILRWRLAPELHWTLNGNNCTSGPYLLSVRSDTGLETVKITEGWESLYYMQKSPVPVLEVLLPPDCRRVITEIQIPH